MPFWAMRGGPCEPSAMIPAPRVPWMWEMSCFKAVLPPLPGEPRKHRYPRRATTCAAHSPSRLRLTMTRALVAPETVNHRGKSKMPAGHQHRTTVSVAKLFMFSPNDGKLAGTVMQPDERGDQRRQKGEPVRV